MAAQLTPRGPRGPYLVDGIGGTPLMQARIARRLTQPQAAAMAGVTERTWRSWERQRSFARLEVVLAKLDLAAGERRLQLLGGIRFEPAAFKPEDARG